MSWPTWQDSERSLSTSSYVIGYNHAREDCANALANWLDEWELCLPEDIKASLLGLLGYEEL